MRYGPTDCDGMPVGAVPLPRRRTFPWLACALAAACVGALVIPGQPARGASGDVGTLLSLINQDRASAGDAPVSLNATLDAIAQSQAQSMAQAGRIFQNPAFPGDVPDANAAGENVGVGPTVAEVHAAFVASPPHQAVMVNPVYREVGIGIAPSAAGLMVAEEFVDHTAGAAVPAPAATTAAPPPPVTVPHPAAPPRAVPAAAAPKMTVTHAAAVAPSTPPAPTPSVAPPPPPPPPPPSIDVALYSRMLQWEQWQASGGPAAPVP
jgi:hypothetical protein